MGWKRKSYGLVAAMAGVLLVTAGCAGTGSDDSTTQDSSDSDVAKEARAVLEKSSAKLEWFDPGPSFSAQPADGAKILFVTVQLNTPFTQHILTGLEKGAALVGATVTPADSLGNPAEAARQVAQGVSQKVDGIVIQGIPSAAISAELKSAKDAGIPVVMLFDQPDTGTPSPEQAEVGVVGNVEICWSCEGTLMAAAAVAEKGEDVNSVFIGAEELTSVIKQQKGYTDELTRLCADCKSEVVYVPVAQWSTGIQGAVTTALSDTAVNVVAPVYDLMIPAAQAAMAAAQAQDRAILISGDATITGVAAMAKDPSVRFMSGAPSEWAGWLAIDQWLRSVNGEEAAADSVIPVRALTKDTIEDEGFDVSDGANETEWFTDIDFEQQFRTLWGL